MLIGHFRELRVYRLAFDAAMRIYHLSREWPRDERFSLIDQIRRSSRSVCGCLAEAWKKRRYPAHFISKLSDADSEVSETQSWLEFARACGYLDDAEFQALDAIYAQISGGLVKMSTKPEEWCIPTDRVREEEPPPYDLD
jgi:four helix bundle protein